MATSIVGVDVAKDKFDVSLLTEDDRYRRKVCRNTPAGFQTLVEWLGKQGVEQARVCMEATGAYWQALAQFLHTQGHEVSVMNPALIKAYGRSELLRNKTDRVDADLIARFCRDKRPRRWEPQPVEVSHLRALGRRLESLKKGRQQEKNRLGSGTFPAEVEDSLRQTIAFMDQQIKAMERAMREHVALHPDLKHRCSLLSSIPGIGRHTASVILGELGDMSQFCDVRQVVAFCGLSPEIQQSGKSVRGKAKMCKKGSARLRRALYMPAMVARHRNPLIKAFCDRLAARGLCKMAVIGAAMRKLIHLAYGILKSNRRFNPDYCPALS